MNAQGLVLGAFFYGYATTNVVGGMLAQRVGGKLLMLAGVFWTAVLTLLTPALTTVGGFGAIFAVRLLEGIGEVIAKFHYTDTDTGPTRTRTFFAAKLRWVRAGPFRRKKVRVRVRVGPVSVSV